MLLWRSQRRKKRGLTVGVFLLSMLYMLYYYYHDLIFPWGNEDQAMSDDPSYLSLVEAENVCRAHHWKPYLHRKHHRKVYDMFLVNTELDWLEIRMSELEHEVDYFVVLEAPSSFVGLPKPLHVSNNWDLFSRWHHKMIYHTLNESGVAGTFKDTFRHEAFQRNGLLNQVLVKIPESDERAPQMDDVILVSDLDEIPRPSTIQTLRNCRFPRRLTLASRFYYYSFQWLHRGEEWPHPQATYYQGPRWTILPDKLRMKGIQEKLETFGNAAWHCSSCYPRLEDYVTKITGFSHTKFNRPEFVDRAKILQRVRQGIDLFDRESEVYDRVEGNTDMPAFLRENGVRFNYMTDRDPPNGNFLDYTDADSGSTI